MPQMQRAVSRRSFVACLFTSAVAAATSGCAPGDGAGSGSADASVSVIYDADLVSLMGYADPQSLIDASGDPNGSYEEAVAGDDGSVTLKMTDEQLASYIEATDNSLDAIAEEFASSYEGCSLSWSDDWKSATCALTVDVATSSDSSYTAYTQTAIVLLAQRQALAHPGDGSWSVEVTLVDSATGSEVGVARSDGTSETYLEEWPGTEDATE